MLFDGTRKEVGRLTIFRLIHHENATAGKHVIQLVALQAHRLVVEAQGVLEVPRLLPELTVREI